MDSADVVISSLVASAVALVQEALPAGWTLDAKPMGFSNGASLPWLDISSPTRNSSAGFLIEARDEMTPRDIRSTFGSSFAWSLRAANGRPVLVVAQHLSLRAREMLTAEGVSYVDLTGNIRIAEGGIFVERLGRPVEKKSSARPASGIGLTGAKAGRVVRVLVDLKPPFAASQVAAAADVTPGYVSQILDRLEAEALIDRAPSGPIIEVDWQALLRRRADAAPLLRPSATSFFLAPMGVAEVLVHLRNRAVNWRGAPDAHWVVTGSHAASTFAPVTAPALLVVHAADPNRLGADLGLVSVDAGAEVALIQAPDDGPFRRSNLRDGLPIAAPSQVAIDCLGGPSRMPSEGIAVLEWMASDESAWRAPSLGALMEG